MSSEPDDTNALLARAREGIEDAARELFDRFSPDILRVIRRKLHKEIRRVFDSTDFLLMTWEDFYAHAGEEVFASSESLRLFLYRIALRNVSHAHRDYLDTQKRDLRRQQPLEHLDVNEGQRPLAHQPTPDEIAGARDEWDQILQGLAPEYRRALVMRRDGNTYQEIAEQTGLNEKTLRRLMEGMRQRVSG